jgi:hypothetical protein
MPKFQSFSDVNVRSQAYYVASANGRCRYCGSPTRLLALVLPRSHETLDMDAPADVWERVNGTAILFYVERLPLDVQRRLTLSSPFFRLERSAAGLSYWANHCESCGVFLDDHELHCEPDAAFMPWSEAAAATIELLEVPEPFEAAAGGYALEPEFLRFMRKL